MRKYTTEFGLNVYTSFKTVIPASQLELLESVDKHKYHIYGILLSPKFFIKDGSVKKYDDHFSVDVFTNAYDEYSEYTLNVVFCEDFNHKKIDLRSTYPHSILKVHIEDEEWCKNILLTPIWNFKQQNYLIIMRLLLLIELSTKYSTLDKHLENVAKEVQLKDCHHTKHCREYL